MHFKQQPKDVKGELTIGAVHLRQTVSSTIEMLVGQLDRWLRPRG